MSDEVVSGGFDHACWLLTLASGSSSGTSEQVQRGTNFGVKYAVQALGRSLSLQSHSLHVKEFKTHVA
mgnify:CR=1 FL=1